MEHQKKLKEETVATCKTIAKKLSKLTSEGAIYYETMATKIEEEVPVRADLIHLLNMDLRKSLEDLKSLSVDLDAMVSHLRSHYEA
jgi:hypothetical protein